MNLQLARDTLATCPPKHFVELTACEAVAMLAVAGFLVFLF